MTTGVATLTSDKTDFKTKTVTRVKEGHHKMIKGPIQEQDIAFVNIYAPDIGTTKYIKHILRDIKVEIDSNIVRVGDFNTSFMSTDRSFRQKINKGPLALNDTLDQVEQINT